MLPELPLRALRGFARTFGVLRVVWTLGDVIRKLRDERGWTQSDLAERAGLDKSAIVRLEKQSDRSERNTIERAARALNVSAADLYALAEEISLSAELSDAERRAVMLFQRRLIEKRQPRADVPPVPSQPLDQPDRVREFDAPAQKRRRK